MSYRIPPIPVPPNPVFVDKAIVEIQTALGTLPWLTHSFGRSYEKETNTAGSDKKGSGSFSEIKTEPVVYVGQAEYLPVLWNDNLQAQSWFVVGKQTPIDYVANHKNIYEVELDIIFWANLKKIDKPKGQNYYFTEELKQDVRALLTNMNPLYSNFEIDMIEENVDDVFKEYTVQQVKRQYFMYPYTGFRFTLTANIREQC